MKYTIYTLIISILACIPVYLIGQVNAKLLPDKLTLNDPGNLFATSDYGYLSLYQRNDFDEARVEPTFISVGDDLVSTLINKTNGFQIMQSGVFLPNDNSRMNLSGLFFGRNFSGSAETWTLDKLSSPGWLTGTKSALRIGRQETNTPAADDRTALLIEPELLKIGINTDTEQPPYRLTVVDNSTTYPTNEVGTVTVFNSGNTPGSSIVGIFNNGGNMTSPTIYAVGKVGGYWNGGGRNAGIHGHITGSGSGGYGVLGTVADASNAGTNINDPSAWGALAFSNLSSIYAVYANGAQFSTTGTMWVTSDQRLKQDIQTLDGALELVKKLEPKTFKYRQDGNFKKLSTPAETQYGFIAQEMEEVLPLLVRDVELLLETPQAAEAGELRQEAVKGDTYKAIQQLGMIPILTAAVKELDLKNVEETDRLKNENRELKDRVAKLEAAVERLLAASETETTTLELSSAKLGQNTPNPTNGGTQINYEVPAGITSAELRISSADGKLIKKLPIPASGAGMVEIDARTLSSGTYFYTLFLDGQLFETKQMIISR